VLNLVSAVERLSAAELLPSRRLGSSFLLFYSKAITRITCFAIRRAQGALPRRPDESPDGESPLIEVYRELEPIMPRPCTHFGASRYFISLSTPLIKYRQTIWMVPVMAPSSRAMYRGPFQVRTAIGSTSEVGSPCLLGAYAMESTERLKSGRPWGWRSQALISSRL